VPPGTGARIGGFGCRSALKLSDLALEGNDVGMLIGKSQPQLFQLCSRFTESRPVSIAFRQ